MPTFNKKKLQIFVSSTFRDLIPERQAAVEAILLAEHIPAGMELFAAGDESQMEVIKQWIDESDAYLLILGGRYGSIHPTLKKSYTQLEYEYALSIKIPVFACVLKDEAIESRVKQHGTSHIETDHGGALKEFRAEVLSKICTLCDDTKDIKLSIIQKLSELSRNDDLKGWVRPIEQPNLPAVMDEVARLSKENADLRAATKPDKIAGVSFEELKDIIGAGGVDFLQEYSGILSVRPCNLVDMNKGHQMFLDALLKRGLIAQEWDMHRGANYSLTESGRIFLNRIVAEQSASDHKARSVETEEAK